MNVNAAELNAIKSLAVAQLTVSRLGSFENSDEIVKQTKCAKKVWWKTIRGRYRLDANKKYSVELDGDKAGELRFKKGGRKNGSAYSNLSEAQRAVPNTSTTAAAAGSSNAGANAACADVVASMNAAFAKAGIPFELKAK
jgi:hypothetical protein